MRTITTVVMLGTLAMACDRPEGADSDSVATVNAIADTYVRGFFDQFPDDATYSAIEPECRLDDPRCCQAERAW